MTANYCSNCGAETTGGQFCSACGAHVDSAATGGQSAGPAGESPTVTPGAAVATGAAATPAHTSAAKLKTRHPPGGSGNKVAIVLAAVVVAALLVVGGILLFAMNRGRRQPARPSRRPRSPCPRPHKPPPAPPHADLHRHRNRHCDGDGSAAGRSGGAGILRLSQRVHLHRRLRRLPHVPQWLDLDGFAANIASAVSGPGQYSGVYSPAHDKEYYFRCVATGGSTSPVDCGYQPTNITNGGLVRLYPIGCGPSRRRSESGIARPSRRPGRPCPVWPRPTPCGP